MGFSEINRKINMKVKKYCQVIINSLLQSMLGFRQAIFPAEEYVSDWVADVKKGLNSLYVYCPLVEPRMVGDAQVPLLRIVPVEGRDGEMITRVFYLILFPVTTTNSDRGNRYKGRHGVYCAIRKRTSGGDTSL
jgi:hypothetical protein